MQVVKGEVAQDELDRVELENASMAMKELYSLIRPLKRLVKPVLDEILPNAQVVAFHD